MCMGCAQSTLGASRITLQKRVRMSRRHIRMIGELCRAPGKIDSSQGNRVYPSDHFLGLRDINLSATLSRVLIMNTTLDLAKKLWALAI